MNCPDCCSDMDEIQPDLHVCLSCGFTAEQIIFELDPNGEDEPFENQHTQKGKRIERITAVTSDPHATDSGGTGRDPKEVPGNKTR